MGIGGLVSLKMKNQTTGKQIVYQHTSEHKTSYYHKIISNPDTCHESVGLKPMLAGSNDWTPIIYIWTIEASLINDCSRVPNQF